MSVNNPTCPENCDAQDLPEVLFSDCAPEINNAQIKNIYLSKLGQPFTDWTSAAEWAARLASAGDDKIIRLTVVAEKPRPEATEKKISHDRTIKGKKNHTINMEIDETNLTNYEFMRFLECGGQFLMWYDSGDTKYMNGGNDGIPSSTNLDDVIGKDASEIELFVGEAKWSSQFSPERIESPIAA